MIPSRLQLKNFTSYGANVTALDFSAFHLACLSGTNGAGKSSILDAITYALWGEARGKSPDDLIKLQENQLEVEFEFQLNDGFYKVLRSRNRKKASTELSLFSKTKAGREWLNLTEGTIKDTQYKIDQILKISYETFVNSAFLRQGRADEFTLKGATERKKILGEILGLQIYDELETKAKEVVKDKVSEITRLETQLAEIENELGQAEIRKTQLEQARENVNQLELKLKDLETVIQGLIQEKEALLILKNNREQIEKSIARQKKELNEFLIQRVKKEEIIKNLKQTVSRQDEIEQKYQERQLLLKADEELNTAYFALVKLKNKKTLIENELRADKTENENALARLNNQNGLLGEEITKKKKDLESIDGQKAKCPLCGNVLDSQHIAEVKEKLTKEIKEKWVLHQKNGKQIEELEKKKFENPEIQTIETEMAKISYDEKKHQNIKAELAKTKGIEQEKMLLNSSAATLSAAEETLKELGSLLATRQKTLTEEEKVLETTPDVSAKLEEVQSTSALETEVQRKLLAQERQARAVLGEATGLVSRSEQLENLKQEKIKQRESLAQEKNIFEELSLAFGKKGIQAMLIETAIPEIEEETNTLLERLTDGRLRVILATQKDTKKGDTVETLEIVISDELGSRPYEMYSGGEAFRVNFALRIALSKLLTHRAGTKLQFLVIDEGFGTQDTQGKERLVDIINHIKDDFEKILVVTHIEELKELFPVRIEVEKKADGSQLQLVGV